MDAYSGISMLRPFTSLVLVAAGFFSTGSNIICSQKIGIGLVMEMAKEVRYFSAFNSNNLIVYLNMNE